MDFIGTSKPTKIDLSQLKPSAQNTKQVHPRAKRVYDAFKKLKGIAGKDYEYASTTINELLYGETGAWRGIEE